MSSRPRREPAAPRSPRSSRSSRPARSGGQRGAAPPRRGPRRDPVRVLAYDALRAVSEREAYANLVLPPMLAAARDTGELDARDAAFATELVYGTLRWQGTYDAVIDACTDRPLGEVDPPVLDALRLGVHQLLGTRVPSHAAVSSCVELARLVLSDGPARFVNAVLRRVAARDLPAWLATLAPPFETSPESHLALVHAHPRWVVSALWDALGGGREGIEALLAADNARPEVTLVARPGRLTAAELLDAARDGDPERARPGRFSPHAVRLAPGGGDPAALRPVDTGRAAVQDEGSQLVALALARAPLAGGGDTRWLDGSAGPGGKAALLGGLAAERGAALLAADLRPHRARLVARALAGNPGPCQVVVADGTRPAWRPGVFDRVLVDVPCTGLGALRRRPEARWRRDPADLDALVPLQRALLRQALSAARPGGVVAYATCSPHLAETRTAVTDVLKRPRADGVTAEWLDARPLLPGVPDLGDGPDVQLWPHRHGTDAMYLALLRRTG